MVLRQVKSYQFIILLNSHADEGTDKRIMHPCYNKCIGDASDEITSLNEEKFYSAEKEAICTASVDNLFTEKSGRECITYSPDAYACEK